MIGYHIIQLHIFILVGWILNSTFFSNRAESLGGEERKKELSSTLTRVHTRARARWHSRKSISQDKSLDRSDRSFQLAHARTHTRARSIDRGCTHLSRWLYMAALNPFLVLSLIHKNLLVQPLPDSYVPYIRTGVSCAVKRGYFFRSLVHFSVGKIVCCKRDKQQTLIYRIIWV